MKGSLVGSGFVSTRSVMLTICRSLDPVSDCRVQAQQNRRHRRTSGKRANESDCPASRHAYNATKTLQRVAPELGTPLQHLRRGHRPRHAVLIGTSFQPYVSCSHSTLAGPMCAPLEHPQQGNGATIRTPWSPCSCPWQRAAQPIRGSPDASVRKTVAHLAWQILPSQSPHSTAQQYHSVETIVVLLYTPLKAARHAQQDKVAVLPGCKKVYV